LKLLPNSLFGRIAMILVGGLVAVQVLTTAIHISERDDLVFRNGASRAAARIDDAVRVLNAVAPAQRPRIMGAITDATLKLADGKPAGGDSVAEAETELYRAAREALTLALEPDTRFDVIDAQPVNLNPESWYAREFGERAGMRIDAAVMLGDGTWITAESTNPPRATTWFTRLLRNLAIVVEDRPSDELLDEMNIDEPRDLLGLYQGTPLNERGWGYGNTLPDRITLFQLSIEDDCNDDENDIIVAIGETLIHELGHYFGMTEEEIMEVEERYWRGEPDPADIEEENGEKP